MSHRIAGILLFLPVPMVLLLFTRQPLGIAASLGAGTVLMLTHRLYARPFVLARKDRRCLWCGSAPGGGPSLTVREPLGPSSWRACGDVHAARARRTLGWAAAHRRFLALGILGSLGVFLTLAAAVAIGAARALEMADAVALFRLGVALCVLPLGWLGPSRGLEVASDAPLPFPVHIQALVGTLWVVWLFRVVGVWWLAAGLAHVVARVA